MNVCGMMNVVIIVILISFLMSLMVSVECVKRSVCLAAGLMIAVECVLIEIVNSAVGLNLDTVLSALMGLN